MLQPTLAIEALRDRFRSVGTRYLFACSVITVVMIAFVAASAVPDAAARSARPSVVGSLFWSLAVLTALGLVVVLAYRAAAPRSKVRDLSDPLLGLLAPFRSASCDVEAALRKEQAEHIDTQLNVMMAINIANLALVTITIWRDADLALLLSWFFAVFTMAAMGIHARLKMRDRQRQPSYSKRMLRRIAFHSGIRGLLWGLCFAFFFGTADPTGKLILLSVSLGMLAGGVPALAPVPPAALLFGLGVVVPTLLRLITIGGVDHFVLAMFGLAFSGSMVMVGGQLYRNFAGNLIARRIHSEQAETISLLLHEYEATASDWLWETDAAGQLVRAPERMLRLLGVPAGDEGDRGVQSLLAKVEASGRTQLLDAMRAGQTFRDLVLETVDADGAQRWVALTASPRADGSYRGVGSDVTARVAAERQAEAARRRAESAEQRLSDGIASLGAGFVLCDANDRPLISNRRYAEIFPASRKTGPNATFGEIIRAQAESWLPDAPDLAAAWCDEVQEKRKFTDKAFDIKLPTGTWLRIEPRATTEGGVVSILTDITDIKQKEARLALQSQHLKASNQELQKFAEVASHDLQEPLRKIETFGTRLTARTNDQLDDDSLRDLQRMLSATQRMRLLIVDLLTYSRMSRQDLNSQTVDLDALLAEVTTDLQPVLARSGGSITATALGTLEGDPVQLREMLENLIANALKFARTDISPVIEITRTTTADYATELRVRDNGIGFDMSYHDKIFEVFQRLHNREEYAGTGVGLATCRKIAGRHGGSIRAESAPMQGATFIVTFPPSTCPATGQALTAA